ncbi:molybdenum ABC transporter ATP-binding protein [Pseudazoarcus pumilus]|uniref:molybdenum ABC transporter ATP-binding protein n=1 Tax=Pseudazoarcus pumilus TaxID=2067960 RepID=UPI001D1785C4|nr:molybdenum ABC transporter ATP-binding protein [Pseudazoarcus pumilus]
MTIAARFRVDRGDFVLDVDLKLPSRGVTALFGPSGAGKTTVLRCIAGLERLADAHVDFDGEVWQHGRDFVPTHRRSLGYVFQEASLFPHLSARGNMEYGFKRIPAAERRIAWDDLVALLDLGHLLDRHPDQLSGGERQRVGLARALLTSPRLLLLDEPLSALDAARKQEILPYLERLRDQLDIPMLYVSHSHDEVIRLADHLVLLDNGRVRASGPLAETLARTDLQLSRGIEASVMIETTVAAHEDDWHLSRLAFAGGELLVPRCRREPGGTLRVRVHARDVALACSRVEDSSINNQIAARVVEIVPADGPAYVLIRLDAAGVPLLARITRRSADRLGLAPGGAVWAQIKSAALLEA